MPAAIAGGWLQVAVKHMPMSSLIVGVDLVPIRPIRGAKTIIGDITSAQCRQVSLLTTSDSEQRAWSWEEEHLAPLGVLHEDISEGWGSYSVQLMCLPLRNPDQHVTYLQGYNNTPAAEVFLPAGAGSERSISKHCRWR